MNSEPFPDFDIDSLHAALDTQRRARGMSWQGVAREISRYFEDAPARAVSPSTLSGMRQRAAIEGDGVLQVLRWLQRSPESFVADHNGLVAGGVALPEPGTRRILRFDARAIYRTLDARRAAREMTWREVASEIGGVNAAGLTRLSNGGRVAFPGIMKILRWLGQPAAVFTRIADL